MKCIVKQKKENKKLKKYEEYFIEMEEVNKKFISVDKIKEKIKELEDTKLCGGILYKAICEDKITILKELLEEGE